MKIVVIGGSGLIGSKLVTRLRAQGHEAAILGEIAQGGLALPFDVRAALEHGRLVERDLRDAVGLGPARVLQRSMAAARRRIYFAQKRQAA